MVFDIYEDITNRMISLLEQGVAPWRSPFTTADGLPQNFVTGKLYRGINCFLLASHRFPTPYFMTYLQAKTMGGHVKKGERGLMVVKYGTYEISTVADDGEPKKRAYLKTYTVFNSSQIDGISFPHAKPPSLPEEQCDRAARIVAAMQNAPEIAEGDGPCYIPNLDLIRMPERRYIPRETAYYSALFHELAHATGHQSRLARKSLLENKGFDVRGPARTIYAEEELVAEMTASFLNGHAGIIESEMENAAAYLQGWISALKSKDAKRWIVKAAGEAQKAADYILGVSPLSETSPEVAEASGTVTGAIGVSGASPAVATTG